MTSRETDAVGNIATIHEPQLDALRRQIAYVAERSPYYRSLAGVALPAELNLDTFASLVPPVTKEQIVDLQREQPPYGPFLATSEDEISRLYAYPTGQVLAWTLGDQQTHEGQYATGLRTMGLTPEDRVDVTFQYGWVVAGTIWDSAARHLGAAVIPGGAGESQRHAQVLRALRATSMIGFSTFIERIAAAAVEIGIDPAHELRVRTIVIVGEWHGTDAKARLSEIYGGAAVREAYGTGETGLVAAECASDPEAMHLHPEMLVEVRDDQTGQLVEDGEPGELYITPLRLQGMPLLRYRTGDITAFIRHDPCACGLTTPRIGRIVGRISQFVRVKGLFLRQSMVAAAISESSDEQLQAWHLTIDRPSGQDRLLLEIEAPDDVPEQVPTDIADRLQRTALLSVDVRKVPPGSLASSEQWFTDNRREN